MKPQAKHIFGTIIFLSTILLAFSLPDTLLDKIMSQLRKYRGNNPVERVYLHIDRPYYVADEHIYYKPYLTNSSTPQVETMGLIYIELVNTENKAIVQSKFKYNHNNGGGGSIHIPDTLSTGQYRLIAYTNWMKNYDESFFFDKSIPIYSKKGYLEDLDNSQAELSVTFFPEGGNLVNGLTSKVGIKAVDQTGKGVKINGKIVDESNSEVSTFNTLHAGIGAFILQPKVTKQYRAVINWNGKEEYYDLPKSLNEGVVMQVNNLGKDNIKIVVQSNSKNYNGSYLLIAQANNQVHYSAESKGNTNGFAANIPKADLPNGITQVTLFNDKGIPLCERLVFVGTEVPTLDITTDHPTTSTRDKVKLTIKTSAASTLSASVSSRQQQAHADNIHTSLLLSSNLKGRIESPGFYFDKNNPYASVALDNLMLTHGWRRFVWKKVLDYEPKKPKYYFESDLLVKGTAYDSSMNVLANHKLSISIPQELSSYEASTDSSGQFQTFVFDYFGKKQVVVQPLEGNREIIIFTPTEGFVERTSDMNLSTLTLEANNEQLLRQIENNEIANAFNSNYHRASNPANQAIIELTKNNYSKMYDKETRLDDYINFPTMRDVFREIVPGMHVPFSGLSLKVFSKDNDSNFDGSPLYLVDGIPTFNTAYILGLNPSDIETIGQITSNEHLNKFGHLGKNGIVTINSKQGKTISSIPEDKTFVSYMGYTMVTEYYTPTYESVKAKNSRTPDLRSLIYWNPKIKTNSDNTTEIEFYTSDQKGTYEVVVEGLTENGDPVSASTTFEVF